VSFLPRFAGARVVDIAGQSKDVPVSIVRHTQRYCILAVSGVPEPSMLQLNIMGEAL